MESVDSMKPNLDERTDPPALATLSALARRSVQPASPEKLRRGWSTVAARLSTRKARRRSLVRLSMAGAAASALVLVVLGVVSLSRTPMSPAAPAALAYQIQGGSVVDGGYLRESGSGGVKLLFAEGTEFVLMPGTRGRLRAVDSAGARIAIEQGRASFQVTPRREAKWFVDVGPFLVTVKGTVFTVSWDADRERFELRLQHGQVSVTGPIAGGAIPLRAGQRLVIDLPRGETLISEQPPEEAWQEAPSEGPSKPEVTAHPTDERPVTGSAGQGALVPPPSASGRTSGRRAWAEALASGDWNRILADVDRLGVKRTLAEVSGEDLFVVADAARYRRRTGLAREALLAERKRFPESPRALDAVFLLGRLEESNERGTHKAIALYEEYLARAPSGTYASEALGRRMMATSKLEGAAPARASAEEYLRRFPSGTYAGAARALLRAP
jgi:ferric-dicitrate binding protein FerR (iron transport regulator)/TolA-binding protein